MFKDFNTPNIKFQLMDNYNYDSTCINDKSLIALKKFTKTL